MIQLNPYKRLNRLIENETFEPTLSWGLRMAIAAIIPVIWGMQNNQMELARWIILTAECICWVELKGSLPQRMRILTGGTVLAILFSILGSITGPYIWPSVILMLFVGFISGLFKNLGDRGSGLAICVFVMFIISNAFPTGNFEELKERVVLTAIGGGWNFIVGFAASLLIPAQEPYRRTIALIWKANAQLVATIRKGWDGKTLRSQVRDVYLKEREVRTAINTSLHFYNTLAHQVSKENKEEYQLAHVRKTTALVATHVSAIGEELESVIIKDVPEELTLRISTAYYALEKVLERMAVFMILMKPEEELLLGSRITRLHKAIVLLKEFPVDGHQNERSVRRVVQLFERTTRLIESALARLQELGDDRPIYRSYSAIKTLFVLHPGHWWRNVKLLFNLNTFTARYALRSAIAATVAMFIAKWFDIERGYWLPFTVIIVVQPYFGATFTKARDRIIGTLAGGLAGGFLVRLPAGLYAKEIMLFLCFVCMVYFIRKKYAVAAFFMTLSLVLIFHVEDEASPMLIVIRALSTIGGAALAILSGFALLPNWDRKWLPVHLSNAVSCNYHYFIATFFSETSIQWVKYKRNAESNNNNAFDSFNRYMHEPAIGKKPYIPFYQLVTHNARVTRELNNIHIEQDSSPDEQTKSATPEQQQKINECLSWFNKNIEVLKSLHPEMKIELKIPDPEYRGAFCLSLHQELYLDKLLYELKVMNRDLEDLRDSGILESAAPSRSFA